MIKVTLKDGKVLELENPMTAYDVAMKISPALHKKALGAVIDGKRSDLMTLISNDCSLEILTFDDKDGKWTLRHTASHILAQAVKRLYPSVKLAIGPAIDEGFYYDFDADFPFTQEVLDKVQKEMDKIVKENFPLERFELPRDEAISFMQEKGEDYKVELIKDLKEGEIISFYKQGDFVDLCAGPHLPKTGMVKAFKLTQTAGAYWRGNEKNKMLKRIYGTAFTKKADLEDYLAKVEEARKRDHNKIGRELQLFTTSDIVGQGLPLFMPKGAKVIQLLQRFVEDEEERRGYLLTKTPLMAKSDLYKISGHWDHYKDGMFVLGDEEKDKEVMALRPMTCPFQYVIYNANQHSYKELPLRYAETSTLFRNEASGEMHGLIRVRQFTLADAHIVVAPEQLEDEFKGVVDLIKYFMSTLGIEEGITYRFSKWDPNNKEKYIDEPEMWETTQDTMRKILNHLNIDYTEADDEAAFYGPKLDIQFKNVFGKEDTLFTIQIDFAIAERFKMTYVDKDGEKKTPFIIHRSSIGCYERTLAMLIETYAGAFPTWLAPVQVRIMNITDAQISYAKEIEALLKSKGIRAEVDFRNEKIGYKIREAQVQKVPYMIILGDKELNEGKLAVRSRKAGDLGAMSKEDFISKITEEIDKKLK